MTPTMLLMLIELLTKQEFTGKIVFNMHKGHLSAKYEKHIVEKING
jgi:hypothetical protein